MTRLACIAAALAFVACQGSGAAPAPRVDSLVADLREARDRIDELERQVVVERDRYLVDLWDGGPTARGPLLALPRLGTMRWTCDPDYGFRIEFTDVVASVHVSYDTPAASRAGIVHPGDDVGATVRAGEPVTWTITHRHEPGFIRARVDVTAARGKRGGCLLPKVGVEETARLYD